MAWFLLVVEGWNVNKYGKRIRQGYHVVGALLRIEHTIFLVFKDDKMGNNLLSFKIMGARVRIKVNGCSG